MDLARDLGTARDVDAEAGTTTRLPKALDAILAELGETPTPVELGPDQLLLRDNARASSKRLVRQLERLGDKVSLELLPMSA